MPTQGATLIAGPVPPEFPELPELPDVAEFPSEVAFPVLPELAFPDLAEVLLEEREPALPVFPPWAEPLAVLSPELPEVASDEPVAEAEPVFPGEP
jgi:homeobox protein ESX1